MANRPIRTTFLLLILLCKQGRGQSVTRCYNEKFDSLMCLPGTGVSIDRFNVYASTTGGPTGLCHRSLDNCTEQLPLNRDFPPRARAACDGRLTCDNLAADLDKLYCGFLDTRVDLSYVTIEYICEPNQTEDIHHVTRCTDQRFDSLMCTGGNSVRISDVFVGSRDTDTCSASVGACHLADSHPVVTSYRQQCDGRPACKDATVDGKAGVCGVGADRHFTMVVYQCVQEDLDLSYTFSCYNKTFDNLACNGGTVIDVTDVYVGMTDVTTGGCSVVPVGGCVYRFPDTTFFTMAYRNICNGRVECRDARAYSTAGVCGSTAENQYTMIGYRCVRPTVSRCYNEKFDSLMCLPGTGISIQRIVVYASTTGGPTGLCHRSRDDCTEQLPPNRAFPARARAACDGRLTCDNLTADLGKVYCGVPDTRVDLSYVTIQYICGTEQREDFRYVSSCFNQSFDNLACDAGTVIDVTDVYVGVTDVTTGECSVVPVGGCVHRFPDTVSFTLSYRELCNGRLECRDARAYSRAGICQSTAETQYTMIGYQCVTPGDTTTRIKTTKTTTTKRPVTTIIPTALTTENESGTASESSTWSTTTGLHLDTDASESTDPGCVGDGLMNTLCRSISVTLQTPYTTGLTLGESGLNSNNVLAVALPVVVLCATAIAVGVVFGIKRRNRQKQNTTGSSLTPTEHIYANQSVSTEPEYVNQLSTPDEIPPTTGEISSERVQYENIPAAAPATYEEVNRVQADQDTAPQYTSLSVPHRGVQGPGHTSYVNVSLPQNVPGDGDAEDGKYMSLDRSPSEEYQPNVYSSLNG